MLSDWKGRMEPFDLGVDPEARRRGVIRWIS